MAALAKRLAAVGVVGVLVGVHMQRHDMIALERPARTLAAPAAPVVAAGTRQPAFAPTAPGRVSGGGGSSGADRERSGAGASTQGRPVECRLGKPGGDHGSALSTSTLGPASQVARSSPGLPLPSRRRVDFDIAVARLRFSATASRGGAGSRAAMECVERPCPESLPAPTRRNRRRQASARPRGRGSPWSPNPCSCRQRGALDMAAGKVRL